MAQKEKRANGGFDPYVMGEGRSQGELLEQSRSNMVAGVRGLYQRCSDIEEWLHEQQKRMKADFYERFLKNFREMSEHQQQVYMHFKQDAERTTALAGSLAALLPFISDPDQKKEIENEINYLNWFRDHELNPAIESMEDHQMEDDELNHMEDQLETQEGILSRAGKLYERTMSALDMTARVVDKGVEVATVFGRHAGRAVSYGTQQLGRGVGAIYNYYMGP